MSEHWIISLLRLRTQSKLLESHLSKNNGYFQIPFTPTALKHNNINNEASRIVLEERTKLISKKGTSKDMDLGSSLVLRDYQKEDVNFLTELNAKGVFNEQRTGKTPTSLVTMKLRNEFRNILVVPSSLMVSWEQEYKKWHQGDVIRMESKFTQKKRHKIYKELTSTQAIIISYGMLAKDIEVIKTTIKSLDAVLVDESHRLRNFKGMRNKYSPQLTKAVMAVGKLAKGRYALTGTLAPNYAWNAFGTFHFLFPDLFKSYYDFLEYYFRFETNSFYKGGKEHQTSTPIGFKNDVREMEFLEFLEMISTQRKRKDVMSWLPDVDKEFIRLNMTPKQSKIYDEFLLHMEYEDYICEGLMDTTIRLSQVSTSPELLGDKDPGCKTEYINQYLKDYPDKPIIIISRFTSYLKLLKEKLNVPLLSGECSQTEKKQLEVDFQEGKFNILLANIDVVKEGFTLSRGETIIFVDRSYVYTDNLQAESRIIPVNKEEAALKNDQKIIVLYANGSFDEQQNTLLEAKAKMADILNNYASYIKQKRSEKLGKT